MKEAEIKEEKFDIEEAFKKLEEINEQLADKGTKLTDAIALYSEGVKLAERCKAELEGVEKEIQILSGEELQ